MLIGLARARRRGAASEVIRASVDWAKQVTRSQGRDCLVAIHAVDNHSGVRAKAGARWLISRLDADAMQ